MCPSFLASHLQWGKVIELYDGSDAITLRNCQSVSQSVSELETNYMNPPQLACLVAVVIVAPVYSCSHQSSADSPLLLFVRISVHMKRCPSVQYASPTVRWEIAVENCTKYTVLI